LQRRSIENQIGRVGQSMSKNELLRDANYNRAAADREEPASVRVKIFSKIDNFFPRKVREDQARDHK